MYEYLKLDYTEMHGQQDIKIWDTMYLLFFFPHEYNSKSTHCRFFALYFYKSTLKLVFILQVKHFCFFNIAFIMKSVKYFYLQILKFLVHFFFIICRMFCGLCKKGISFKCNKFVWMHHGVLRYIQEMIRQHNNFFII